MDFPISELMDREACQTWILAYFHPEGMNCPHCGSKHDESRWFRRTIQSDLDVYRCKICQGVYNVYSGTVFEGRHFQPEETVLFLRGVCQGKTSAQLARELGMSRTTITAVRHEVQANAELEQPEDPLDDLEAETDEMFQNSGEKR